MKNVLKYGLTACLAVAFVFGGCKKDEDDAKYSVTLSANNAEWGVVAGAGEYDEGTEITIMATANSGYHFQNWSDGDATNPRTITVDKNIALIAVFAQGAANPQNNGQNPQNGNNDNSGQQPVANGDILPNKVTKIVCTYMYDDDGELKSETYLFNSEGRSTKYTGPWENCEFEYTENTIKSIGGYAQTWGIENGRLATRNSKPKYGYSPDGYLIDADGERFTIENGLWTKETYYEADGNGREYNYEAKFTYGTNQNNLNVDLVLLLLDFEEYGVFSGLYGNRVKLLPTLIEGSDYYTENGVKGEVEYEKMEFSYEYSGEYITKIIVKETEDGEVYEYTYEIFY